MFEFSWPWLLLLFPAPWLIQRFVPEDRIQQVAALRIPFFQVIARLNQQQQQTNKLTLSRLIAYLLWMLLVIAAAGPQWLGAPSNLPRSGRDIMLAVDISGSMQTPDMLWQNQAATRIEVVKAVAADFIERRKGDRIGLVLFGSKAYLQAPLTFDRATVQTMLDDASVGLAGTQTAIGDAIGLAIKKMQQAGKPIKSRVLILLTDGINNSGVIAPLQAAQIAAEENIRIYTIGIGADQMLIQSFLGPQLVNPSADLDAKTLQDIANITSGSFFRAKDTKGLQKIYEQLDELEPISSDEAVYRPVTPWYYWPLLAALLLSIWLSIRHLPRKQTAATVSVGAADVI